MKTIIFLALLLSSCTKECIKIDVPPVKDTCNPKTGNCSFDTLKRAYIEVQLWLNTDTASSSNNADGLVALFENNERWTYGLGDEDADKFKNPMENIAMVHEGTKLLSLNAQPFPAKGKADTIPLRVWNLTQTKYYLLLSASVENRGINYYIVDKYNNSKTAITIAPQFYEFNAIEERDRFSLITENK